jgi:hypothetical protein
VVHKFGVWLGKYEAGGLEGLVDGSHRPAGHPAQMAAAVEVAVLEARRSHPSWGPQRIAVELGRRGIYTSDLFPVSGTPQPDKLSPLITRQGPIQHRPALPQQRHRFRTGYLVDDPRRPR